MSDAAATALDYKVPRRRHPVVHFMVHQSLGAAGLAVIVIMTVAAIVAPLVAPYDPLTVDYEAMLGAPSWQHWMGTDSFGRDVMSRIIFGARTALAVGFLASFAGCTVGAIIGVVSAYFGGKTYSGTDTPNASSGPLPPGQATSYASGSNPLRDRDFLSVSVSYAF